MDTISLNLAVKVRDRAQGRQRQVRKNLKTEPSSKAFSTKPVFIFAYLCTKYFDDINLELDRFILLKVNEI
jgi:hypothetical protein